MRVFLLFITLFIFAPTQAADYPPVPPSKKERLGDLEQKLKQQEQQKKKLEAKTKELENELGSTKNKLVKISRSIQNNEKTLQGLESRIDKLYKEQLIIQDKLKEDRKSIARLILALERIRRVPPEALIAKPGAPLKTAQSAMLMRDIIPALNTQAETLRLNLENLDKITKDLETKRQKALKTSEQLKAKHNKLSGLVGKREKLYTATRSDLKAQKENVRQISKQAKNLKDLVKKLDENKKLRTASLTGPKVYVPTPGKPQLPISGIIRTSYGQRDAIGAESKGLTIEGRSGALIVAPMGGIVRFAGYFKNHGNIVILEHKNGYHSLIAGLQKIDTVVGHSVSSGEPLGLLHYADGNQKPTLYYELRLKGKPINPAHKFTNLG